MVLKTAPGHCSLTNCVNTAVVSGKFRVCCRSPNSGPWLKHPTEKALEPSSSRNLEWLRVRSAGNKSNSCCTSRHEIGGGRAKSSCEHSSATCNDDTSFPVLLAKTSATTEAAGSGLRAHFPLRDGDAGSGLGPILRRARFPTGDGDTGSGLLPTRGMPRCPTEADAHSCVGLTLWWAHFR